MIQLPEVKQIDIASPIANYYALQRQSRQDETRDRMLQDQSEISRMRLDEYKAESPQRALQAKLKALESDTKLAEYGKSLMGAIDTSLPDDEFNQQALRSVYEYTQTLQSPQYGFSPDEANKVAEFIVKSGGATKNAVKQIQIKQGIIEPEKSQIVDGQVVTLSGDKGTAKPIENFVDSGKQQVVGNKLVTYKKDGSTTVTNIAGLDKEEKDKIQQQIINGQLVTIKNGVPQPVQEIPGLVTATEENTASDKAEATQIAGAIMRGEQPPEMSGMGRTRLGAMVKAELSRNKYDLTEASLDYAGQKRFISTLNGPQQTRLRQAVDFTKESLDIVEDLAKEWNGGKFAPLNKVNLIAAKNGAYGEKAASIATRLESQVNDMASELGTVYKGGNSSTDESLRLAASNLKAEWSEKVLLDNVAQVRKNLQLRENSLKSIKASGMSGDTSFSTRGEEEKKTTADTTTPKPPKQLDASTAKQYLQKANGDKAKARELAKQDGYTF